MKKCTTCGSYRSKLHTCVICGKKLCGCCSIKSTLNGKRVCCDGTLVCGRENKRRYQAELAADIPPTMDTSRARPMPMDGTDYHVYGEE